ncbi:helix-turn-helix domain-containing protein [Pseudobacillus sp. 179-B 2D1 NHS]|uniref:helix-turn-helix domain-containing protein n=1 Tax=Pseudobacillus sp. 179-B 2D1 NHS TaxID=3374292 RepID=UPI0038792863
MESSSIPSLIQEWLASLTVKVWIRNHRNHQFRLIYENGRDTSLFSLPKAPMKKTGKYTIYQNNGNRFISFFYPNDCEILIWASQDAYVDITERLEQLYTFFYLIYQQEVIRTKDAELEHLIEGISAISSLDEKDCLEAIINSAINVIPSADAGFLQLFDYDSECLTVKASIGFNHSIKEFKIRVKEAITGIVFHDGKPRIFQTKEEIFDEMDHYHISKANFDILMSASDGHAIKAMLCTPVTIGQKRIGVLAVHQFYQNGKLISRDLELLKVFADQAAIAIQNAQLYDELKIRLNEVTMLSQQLKEKNKFLLKRDNVHRLLTSLSLQNKGPASIISALRRMLDTPVFYINFIEDEYIPNVKGRSRPFSVEEISLIFSERREPVFIDVFDIYQEHFYLYPITDGTVFLGCLIVKVEGELSKIAQTTVEQGGTILSLEAVKEQTLTDVYYKKIHEYFSKLLQNEDPELLVLKGKEFGLNLSSYFCVALAEIPACSDLRMLEAIVHQFISTIKKNLKNRDMLIFGLNNKVTILAPFESPVELKAFTEEISTIIEERRHQDVLGVSIGVGNAYTGVELIKKSYHEAVKALSYLTTRNETGVIQYKQIGINRFFLHQSPEEVKDFSDEILGPLMDKEEINSELEKTLFSYIIMNRSASKTAKKLHIHPNTLYKRLKKIEETLGLALDNHEDFLKIQLAFHLRGNF